MYIVGFIAGYGTYLPFCFIIQRNDVTIVYNNVYYGYVLSCFYIFPTIFMSVVYYKIGRELIKQNRYMKRECSNPVRRSAPDSSFNILKFIRNRRTFFVCLITVLCYAIGNIPITVHRILLIAEEDHLLKKYVWIKYLARVVRVAGLHSVNPLIYGRLDKKLLPFWKLCRKKKQRPRGNWLAGPCQVVSGWGRELKKFGPPPIPGLLPKKFSGKRKFSRKMLATVWGGGEEVDVLFPKTKRPKTFYKHYFYVRGA
jgi:hypothetical protein